MNTSITKLFLPTDEVLAAIPDEALLQARAFAALFFYEFGFEGRGTGASHS